MQHELATMNVCRGDFHPQRCCPFPQFCSRSCWGRDKCHCSHKVSGRHEPGGGQCRSPNLAAPLTAADQQGEWVQLWCSPCHLAHLVGQGLVDGRLGVDDPCGHILHAPLLQRGNNVRHLGVYQLQPANKVSEGGPFWESLRCISSDASSSARSGRRRGFGNSLGAQH